MPLALLPLALVLLLAGCGLSPRPDPTVFLVLAPGDAAPAGAPSARTDAGAAAARTPSPTLRIGVGPVTLPRYLDRPQLVTRVSPTELRVHEHHRWSAPLGELVAEALAERILQRLGAEEVVLFPWPAGARPGAAVRVAVQQLEVVRPDSAVLRGRWELLDGDGQRVGATRTVDYRIGASAAPGAAAPALSELVARLADEIAGAIGAASAAGAMGSAGPIGR